jgi:hypothetical protein
VRRLAEHIAGQEADVLALAGDTFAFDLSLLEECLELFAAFEGRKLLVAGNHCLWVREGGDSYARYAEELPRAARRLGWHPLDAEPLVVESVAFVGTVGWYDYSFRDPAAGVPDRFYRAKIGPGAAGQLARYRHLLDSTGDLRPEHLRMAARWMDGEFVRWSFTDEEFTQLVVDNLAAHLRLVRNHAQAIVAILHHVPFREMVRQRPDDPSWSFANAFQGAAVLGEVLRAEPRVRHLVCAHVHLPQEIGVGSIACYNVGSQIKTKRVVELTPEAG